MPVFGSLSTMALPDLLQWAALTQKTGVLEIERNRICRGIEFRKGFIGACSSDDPANRIGQVLLSRGKISERQLQQALACQQREGRNLCVALIEMGALTQQDVACFIAAKAEDTIQSLFEWDDAVFRFYEGATLDSNLVEVSLTVNDILLKGLQHQDELARIREVFRSGTVLKRTERPIPDELMTRPTSRRILELIDGSRPLFEILGHSHVSEFLTAKLLHKLHASNLVKIIGERQSVKPTVLDQPTHKVRTETPVWKPPVIGHCPQREIDHGYALQQGDEAEVNIIEDAVGAEIGVANLLMERGDYSVAIDLLRSALRAHPKHALLQPMISKAEQAFVETAQVTISSSNVPVFVECREQIDTSTLGPDETLLLGMIDEKSDIKSILWLAPMSEMEALRALQKMLDSGLIEVKSPEELAVEAPPAILG